jgi:hypothetical protein
MANKIAALNDAFRSTLGGAHPTDGCVVVTSSVVHQFKPERVAEIAKIVAEYTNFNNDNDPYGEHDLGNFEYGGQQFLWKIDYYNRTRDSGSENPADPAVTFRILTIMLASDS